MHDEISQVIGPYRVGREIGRGGMGVVYLARDERLERNVAIKALPEEVGGDEERLARFEREAKVLAALNHPNIAAVYGLEEVDERRYLVLEYVDGETLAEIISRGSIPVPEAMAIARQIAEAVEAAHEKGIIHRDLKPANIKLTATDQVKVLDFGLAKAIAQAPASGGSTDSPTVVPGATPTMPGVVLGTAGYLSPEQARGRQVDRRTDIWSFGCVLFEMLTGQPIFPGETVTDSLGATLHKEPDWSALPPDTPPVVTLLLRRCLAKDRRRRLHHIADARVEIEEAIADPSASSLNLAGAALEAAARIPSRERRGRRVVPAAMALGGLVLGVAVTMGWLALRPEAARQIERLSITLPHRTSEVGRTNVLDVCADGRRLLYTASRDDQLQLFVRAIDQRDPRPLPGTEDTLVAGFSPDGEWVTFYSRGALRRASLRGGPSTTLVEVGSISGVSWGDDGSIYYTVWGQGLMRIGENGGESETLVSSGDHDDSLFRGVLALPGGDAVLFASSMAFRTDISINALDRRTGESRQLIENGSSPRLAGRRHLLFVRESTLMAAPFDPERVEITGHAVPLTEHVRTTYGFSCVDVSDAGVLYHIGGGLQESGMALQTLTASGKPEPLSLRSSFMGRVRLAPDGRRIAVVVLPEAEREEQSIWILDIERDQLTMLTSEPGRHGTPCWSPDGSFVYYITGHDEGESESEVLSRRRADGGDPEILMADLPPRSRLNEVLPDGRLIVRVRSENSSGGDLMILRLDPEPILEPWLATTADESSARVSPDGRWVAYESEESGDDEVYVRPLEDDGTRWAVSRDGGRDPFWSSDGRTLYFLEGGGASTAVMAAKVTAGVGAESEASEVAVGPFRSAVPTRWTVLPPVVRSANLEAFPDGDRLLVVAPIEEQRDDPLEIFVTRSFFDELERATRPLSR